VVATDETETTERLVTIPLSTTLTPAHKEVVEVVVEVEVDFHQLVVLPVEFLGEVEMMGILLPPSRLALPPRHLSPLD